MESLARDNEMFEAFCWAHCRGKNLIELPIGDFHRDLMTVVDKDRVGIAAPRGFAKSSYLGKFYPTFFSCEEPSTRTMIVSATSDLAESHLEDIRGILRRPSIKTFYGEQETKAWRVDELILKNKSIIQGKGAGKQIRGFHPDLVVVDDIETDEIVASPERLKKLEHWFWTDLMGVLKKTSRIFVIGTLLHPESFLARLIDHPREGWTTRFYQAIKKDGCPLWPEMWSLMELDRLRRELGSTAFRQEYMNEPLPDELRTFRREHIRYFDQEPEGCIYFTTIDPAIELKTTSDFSAIVTVAVDPDENMYVVEYINKRMLPSELIDSIFSTWLKWKSQVVGIETVGFQKMIKIEIDKERVKRRQYPVIVELKSEGRRKELRIQSLQPRFEAGKIYIRKGMDELETQLLRFPSPRCKDDLCDALAYTLEIIRPSHRPVTQMNPECFLAELERRRHYFHGRRGVWGNHKLQRV